MNNNTLNKRNSSNTSTSNSKKDRSSRWIVLAVLGFFIGFGLIIGFYGVTLISLVDFSKILSAFAVVGFLVPLKLYRKWFHFIKYEVVIFNIVGMAPFFTGLFLVLNFLFSTTLSTNEHFIEKVYLGSYENNLPPKIILENNLYEEQSKITEITPEESPEVITSNYLKLTLGKGLFGFEVIKERTFFKKNLTP